MREIKFRAWDKDLKKLTEPFYVGSQISMICEPEMQYTGLKDKNGKEIYEGDILRDDRVDEYNLYEIKWNEYGTYADGLEDEIWEDVANDYLEVIGNIYENPELLK